MEVCEIVDHRIREFRRQQKFMRVWHTLTRPPRKRYELCQERDVPLHWLFDLIVGCIARIKTATHANTVVGTRRANGRQRLLQGLPDILLLYDQRSCRRAVP